MEDRRLTMQHRIAGIVFETVSNEPIPGLDSEPFLQFSVSDQRPDVRHLFWKVDPHREGCGPGTASSTLRSFRMTQRLGRIGCGALRVGEHWTMIRDDVRNSLEIHYLGNAGDAKLPWRKGTEFFIAANMRQIFSSFLPCFSAILFHSSGVVRGDRAAIFIAPNEGGKTTVAMLGEGSPILSGDHVILRKERGEFVAYATPLGGMTSGPCRAKIGGLFVLRKADVFGLAAFSRKEFLRRLWAEHRNYTFLLPMNLRKRAFELLSDLCSRTPLFEMAFPRESVDWVEIDKVMREAGCG